MQSSYVNILENILDDRIRANPSYSMRSFARDLKIAPSTLSEVLKKKKGISTKKASEIVTALKLPEWQASHFVNLVALKNSKTKSAKDKILESIKEQQSVIHVEKLKADAMKSLTSTLDLAILECVNLKHFNHTVEWIAEKLKISDKEVKKVVERLVSVKLLEVPEDGGEWIDLSPYFSSSDGIPSESIRAFNIDILKTMEKKIVDEPINDRIMKSVVFSLEDDHVAEAKKILDDAIAKIMTLSSKSEEKKDHVLCFSSQLFYMAKGNV